MELAGLRQTAAAIVRHAPVAPVLVLRVVNLRRRKGEVGGRGGVQFRKILRRGFLVRAAASEDHGVVKLLEKHEDFTSIGESNDEIGSFSGLGLSEVPVTICQTRTLDPVLSLNDALPALKHALNDLELRTPPSKSGIIRIQVLALSSCPCVSALGRWFSWL